MTDDVEAYVPVSYLKLTRAEIVLRVVDIIQDSVACWQRSNPPEDVIEGAQAMAQSVLTAMFVSFNDVGIPVPQGQEAHRIAHWVISLAAHTVHHWNITQA